MTEAAPRNSYWAVRLNEEGSSEGSDEKRDETGDWGAGRDPNGKKLMFASGKGHRTAPALRKEGATK